nr:TraB/GumN family protein [uncultured Undibacterium sp.]
MIDKILALKAMNSIQKIFYTNTIYLLLMLVNSDAKAQALCNIDQIKVKETTGMLFSVKKDDNLLAYVFGSLHVGYGPIKNLPKPVEIALLKSKKYYVEWHPVDDKKSVQETDIIFPEKGIRNLKTVLSDDNYRTLSEHLDILKLSPSERAFAESLHPNKLIQDLLEPDPPELHKSTPLDHQLLLLVIQHGIEVGGLETTQEHWLPIAAVTTDKRINLSATESIKELLCITCLEERRQIGPCTLELTRIGEPDLLVSMLEKFYDRRPIAKEHLATIAFSRNAGMIKKISSTLGKEPTFFVNIGALHLGGKHGVLQGLRDLGYTVEKVTE